MRSTTQSPEQPSFRTDIATAWRRSRLYGISDDIAFPAQTPPRLDDSLARAALPVLDRALSDLDGAPLAMALADRTARLVDVRSPDPLVRAPLVELGLVPGAQLAEDVIGTNAVGTPLETRSALLVQGPEHFNRALHRFTCYGHPILHPVTGRLIGVLDIGGPTGSDHRLFPQLVRRMVRDIEERLQRDSQQTHHRLLDVFQQATKRRGRPVVVMGDELVLATPAALGMLEPPDHAALRTCAELTHAGGDRSHRLTLTSGRAIEMACTPIDDVDGTLIDIVATEIAPRPRRAVKPRALAWPLLVAGEPGSGRTTEARTVAGTDAEIIDAADVVALGEDAWAANAACLLQSAGPAVIVEHVHLLSDALVTLLSRWLGTTSRRVVLTCAPDDGSARAQDRLMALCASYRELLPLRRRREEIPRLAQLMFADAAGADGRARMTPETLRVLAEQPWPGNLAELRRVVGALAATRTAGDIVPADLPGSHRFRGRGSTSPLRLAEREIIVNALEAAGGNRKQAARAIGLSRSTLYNRMRALHID
ncbi:sigma 54 type regulator [Nocardia neocaledoniensis NBRC 108232]|uniref:Transcriptional regulator of acetoin/glycerol metabolism n=1 Tax=Nocardia neocaledoniensis TaxID=236511 RepID=A0A317N113_9NOCA|nr:helix-turn-helix domain-containing protein [Nocardia neocaledoniensis]PWV67555.1 transcriptional regulator of acetoin/glycerol metabolism [Nocardia neocaledoniensis]GEM31253.1 sigma 54 type regulator [Nocardia neocaledoniensis NBRC 108232]